MTVEVSCGQCHGRLLIENPGLVVACPHCGVHLSFPGPDAASNIHDDSESASTAKDPDLTQDPSRPAESASFDVPAETVIRSAAEIKSSGFSWPSAASDPDTSEAVSIDIAPSLGNDIAETFVGGRSAGHQHSLPVNFDFGPLAKPNHQLPTKEVDLEHTSTSKPPPEFKTPAFADIPLPAPLQSIPGSTLPTFRESPASDLASTFAKTDTSSNQGLLTMLLIVVGSYASLLTIYLVYLTIFGRAHQLESLPDLKTVQQQGGRANIPRPVNDLPPGHDLKLGQAQRYGDIRVTPLRVTRGPLSFTHFSGDATRDRSPTTPVLKLWLKFENVSTRQSITPLDSTLMYFRRGLGDVISYNVIFPESERRNKKGQFFYNFDKMAVDSEWLIVGQNANQTLSPHETIETFVASEEAIDELSGKLVWRIHFRKGHGPKTGNGVTTLVDVHFNSDDIQPDSV